MKTIAPFASNENYTFFITFFGKCSNLFSFATISGTCVGHHFHCLVCISCLYSFNFVHVKIIPKLLQYFLYVLFIIIFLLLICQVIILRKLSKLVLYYIEVWILVKSLSWQENCSSGGEENFS